MKVREKLFQLCREMGVEPELSTFPKRKQLQKLTYLFQAFGLDLNFKFSWYVHGPYDSSLTKVLYNDDKEISTRQVPESFKDEKKKLKALKNFLGKDVESSRVLELIGSLHFIVNHTKNNKSDQEIIDKLLELKPQFGEGETRYYLKKIKELMNNHQNN